MWHVIWALLMVLAAIALFRGLLRGAGFGLPQGQKRRLRVIESVSLGGRQRLHVVDVAGEELLLSSSESGIHLLRPLPARELKQHRSESETEEPPQTPGIWRNRLRALARPALLVLVALVFDPGGAFAASPSDVDAAQLSLSLDGLTAPDRISSTLEIVALFTLISVAPSILLMMTSFTRIFIVLTLLRQALGINQIPPNQVMAGLALFTTFFVMAPVGEEVYAEAVVPYMERDLDASEATQRAIIPVRDYLIDHTRVKDLRLFVDLSGVPLPEDPKQVSFATLLPAYMISEMRTAFEIGFMIYLPFLVIDLVIASMLISLGMIVLPPMMIALPFKLMLFVLLDGWNLVLSSLVTGLM